MKLKILIISIIIFTYSQVHSIEKDPTFFLKNIIEQCKPILNKNNDDILEQTIIKYIDFNEMALWIAGKTTWNNTNIKKQNEFIVELQKLMLKTYKKTVYHYADADIHFPLKLQTKTSSKKIQIQSIMKKNNKTVSINYRLIQKNDSWMVFDIIIEGISILKSLKTQFSDIIKTEGIDIAINKMQKLNKS